MHDPRTWGGLLGCAMMFVIPWLLMGRRFVGPPPAGLPVTFRSSRLVCAIRLGLFGFPALMFLCMGIDFLFFETDAGIGGVVARFGFAAVALVFCAVLTPLARPFAAKLFWPDRIIISDSGIDCRLDGGLQHWAWDRIRDVAVANNTRGSGPLILEIRGEGRISLGNSWKPTGVLTSGEGAICDAIRAELVRRRILTA